MIHAPGILRVRVLIDGRSTVLLRKKFFDFPSIRFNAHRELEVLFGDIIPELVDHHDGEQVTERSEEETIKIVLYVVTDCIAESVQKHLSADKDNNPKSDVPQRPAVFERIHYQEELHNEIDRDADRIEDV